MAGVHNIKKSSNLQHNLGNDSDSDLLWCTRKSHENSDVTHIIIYHVKNVRYVHMKLTCTNVSSSIYICKYLKKEFQYTFDTEPVKSCK
jgi:hypothetical protein